MAAVCAFAGYSHAGPETTFTYQGVLEQGGQPVTGTRTMRFGLTTDPTGMSVGGRITLDVDIAQGLFTANLDFGEDIVQAYVNVPGEPQWHVLVEVQEPDTSFTKLLPPQPITGVPFSTNTRGVMVDADKNIFVENAMVVGDAEDTPDVVTTAFNFDLGEGTGRQNLLAFSPQPTFSLFARLGPTPSGETGQFEFLDSTGNLLASLGAADVNGINAGFLNLYAEPASSGAEIRLHSSKNTETVLLSGGVTSPRLTMTGFFHSLHIDLDQFEDASVVLPLKSVGAPEILNEAGVVWAEAVQPPLQTEIVSAEIEAPSDGFVIAMLDGSAELTTSSGFGGGLFFAISVCSFDGVAFDCEQQSEWLEHARSFGVGPHSDDPVQYTIPVSTQRVVPVAQGRYRFLALGGSFTTATENVEARLTLLFVPTSYAPPGQLGSHPVHAAPFTQAPVVSPTAEPSGSMISGRLAVLEAENVDLHRRLDELHAMLEHVLASGEGAP